MANRKKYFSDSTVVSLWLFPVTYFFHIVEEWWADFPSHLVRTQGVVLSQGWFVGLQSVGLILMVMGVVLSRKLQFPNQMLAIFATIVIGNSMTHILRSLLFGGYEPGLLTSLLFWIPLGSITLKREWQRLNISRYLLSAAVGIAICCAIELVTISL